MASGGALTTASPSLAPTNTDELVDDAVAHGWDRHVL